MLVPDYEERSDPIEFKYELSQNCIELQWKNGIFEINNEK